MAIHINSFTHQRELAATWVLLSLFLSLGYHAFVNYRFAIGNERPLITGQEMEVLFTFVQYMPP